MTIEEQQYFVRLLNSLLVRTEHLDDTSHVVSLVWAWVLCGVIPSNNYTWDETRVRLALASGDLIVWC